MICLSSDIRRIVLFMLFVLCSFPHYKPQSCESWAPRKKHINIRRAAVKPWKKSSVVTTKNPTSNYRASTQQMLQSGLRASCRTNDVHWLSSYRIWVRSLGVTWYLHAHTHTTFGNYSPEARCSAHCLSDCFKDNMNLFFFFLLL